MRLGLGLWLRVCLSTLVTVGVFIREVVRAVSLYGDYQVFLRANGLNELIRRRVGELRGPTR